MPLLSLHHSDPHPPPFSERPATTSLGRDAPEPAYISADYSRFSGPLGDLAGARFLFFARTTVRTHAQCVTKTRA